MTEDRRHEVQATVHITAEIAQQVAGLRAAYGCLLDVFLDGLERELAADPGRQLVALPEISARRVFPSGPQSVPLWEVTAAATIEAAPPNPFKVLGEVLADQANPTRRRI